MVEDERLGYLGKAIRALDNTGDKTDRMGARVVAAILHERGGDIFTYRSPRQALQELNNSEDLSERLNAVLSCFNISPKAATFLRIGSSCTRRELRSWFQDTFVDKKRPNFVGNQAYVYCKTLKQFGMVEVADGDMIMLTRFGREVGQPAAAKILSYEAEEKQSLYPVFGQISVGSEDSQRAPLTRTKILLELIQKQQGNTTDFVAIHPDAQIIADSLLQLQAAGMVDLRYERSIRERKTSQYRILEHADRAKIGETSRKREPFAEMVASACETLAKQGKRITMKSVFPLIPESYRNNHAKKALTIDIHHFLKAFATEIHFLEDTSRNQVQEIIQSAKLTQKGEKLVRELLLPLVQALQSDSIIFEWRQELVPQMQKDLSTLAQGTFDVYAPYGRGTIRRDRESIKENILQCVVSLAGSITNEQGENDLRMEDIWRLTGLHLQTVRNFLKELVAEGKVQMIHRGSYNIYSVSDTKLN